MEELILSSVERFELLKESRNITVAVSGGADSVALLYALYSLKDKLNIKLNAAHLNHMIRGEEAVRDEEFVKKLCEKLGVPFFSERIDVPAYARENKLSLELAAREVRYDFLSRVNSGLVATAHTASDNLETMLFNLTRGTALKGLCGIPPKRDIFIRPLILATREDVENYCHKNGLQYVTDSTNQSDDYTRNKIRHNVIPVLREINSACERSAVKTASSLNEDNLYLENCALSFLLANKTDDGLKVSNLPDKAVAKRAVKLYAESIISDLNLDNIHINEIYGICFMGGRVSLPKDMQAEVENGILKITKAKCKNTSKIEYSVETESRINDLFTNNEKVNSLLLNNSLACDKIMGKLVLRNRLSGDSIKLRGRGCTKSLTKLMNEMSVPVELRESLPVMADDGGVVWIYGIGVAERCKVTRKTENILIIKVKETKNNC